MQAATLEVLVQKGRFDPQIALAVAEAIDMALGSSQIVTVPVLDARLDALEARVNARFDAVEANVDARFKTFEAKMDARFEASEARVDVRFEAFEARVNARFEVSEARANEHFAAVNARFEAAEAKTDAKLQSMKTELIFWIIGVTVGTAFLPKLAATVSEAVRALY